MGGTSYWGEMAIDMGGVVVVGGGAGFWSLPDDAGVDADADAVANGDDDGDGNDDSKLALIN